MPIADGSKVLLHFSVFDGEGKLLEQSEESDPLEYIHGEGEIAPGLERELTGRNTGDEFEITLSPDDAYGTHNPAEVIAIPREELPEGLEVAPGDWLPIMIEADDGEESAEEELEVRVIEASDEAVVIDLNHPFAGLDLTFKVQVVEIESA